MHVSLIIPALNEQENIPRLWSKLQTVTSQSPEVRFEVVFVNDGSSDATSERICTLAAGSNLGWKLVELSRNFGHQAALSAGISHAQGEVLIFLDADLQDPPEMIPEFLAKYREGFDVVYGIRQNRKEVWWLRLCFRAFYRIFNSIAERPIPLDAGDFGLVSRRVAQLMMEMPERDRLLRGLRSWVGFRQIGIPYNRPERNFGSSQYRLSIRINGALDGLFGFSKVPIRFSLFVGLAVFVICGIYLALSYIMMFVTGDHTVIGWRSVITLAFMLGAANLIALSVVGEYVWRIYAQTKGRPLYIVGRMVSSETK